MNHLVVPLKTRCWNSWRFLYVYKYCFFKKINKTKHCLLVTQTVELRLWAWMFAGSPSSIISAFCIRSDRINLLWVLSTKQWQLMEAHRYMLPITASAICNLISSPIQTKVCTALSLLSFRKALKTQVILQALGQGSLWPHWNVSKLLCFPSLWIVVLSFLFLCYYGVFSPSCILPWIFELPFGNWAVLEIVLIPKINPYIQATLTLFVNSLCKLQARVFVVQSSDAQVCLTCWSKALYCLNGCADSLASI